MKEQVMYKDLAKYYDLIYHWKDYKSESKRLIELIQKHKKTEGKELLELGCGTGHHLSYLSKKYNCLGTDISKEILKEAKKAVKEADFKQSDMLSLKLNKKFDIILSLFSSISYVKTLSNLRKTIKNISEHMNKGAVVIVEPWFAPDQFNPGSPYLHTYESKDLKIARASTTRKRGNLSIVDYDFLITHRNKPTFHIKDKHEMGLFSVDKTLKYFKEAGIKTKYQKNGFMNKRGLFIGVKQ